MCETTNVTFLRDLQRAFPKVSLYCRDSTEERFNSSRVLFSLAVAILYSPLWVQRVDSIPCSKLLLMSELTSIEENSSKMLHF